MENNSQIAVVNPASQASPLSLIQVAIERGADISQIEKLMELQERHEANQARKAYVQAMAEFKATVPKLIKNKTVGFGKTQYKHATLDSICNQISPCLSAVGLSFGWETSNENNAIVVTCTVTHVEGHSERVKLQGNPDTSGSKNSIQAVGSTVTYLQRYTLLAALGLATEDQDDDGAATSDCFDTVAAIESAQTMGELQTVFTDAFRAATDTGVKRMITEAKDKRKKELMEAANGSAQ